MQLLEGVREAETIQWFKTFENIIVVVDPVKLENASVGGWRRTLVRCMQLVVNGWKTRCKLLSSSFTFLSHMRFRCTATDWKTLYLASRVVLRLAHLPGPPLRNMPQLLKELTTHLQTVEQAKPIEIPELEYGYMAIKEPAVAIPHRSSTLLNIIPPHGEQEKDRQENLVQWGKTVEHLFRLCMLLPGEKRPEAWDQLTPRMLVWRSLIGPRVGATAGGVGDETTFGSEVTEWVRREVVRCVVDDHERGGDLHGRDVVMDG
jgi:nucleolar pre-ribosomal-associated protein 1